MWAYILGQLNIRQLYKIKSYYLVADPLCTITAVSLWPVDITRLLLSSFEILFPAFNAAISNCCLFWGVSAFTPAVEIHVQSYFNLEIDLGNLRLSIYLPLQIPWLNWVGCFGSLSWCNMKHFPMNLVAFSWILVDKMVLYPSKFILLLSSYILGIEPTTFCTANAMLYHWATGTRWHIPCFLYLKN